MSEIKLQPDEIAAYKYSKSVKMVETRIINAFMDGCEHKDNEPIVKRLASILVSVKEQMHHHAQKERLEVHSQKESSTHKFLIEVKDNLEMSLHMMKNYNEVDL